MLLLLKVTQDQPIWTKLRFHLFDVQHPSGGQLTDCGLRLVGKKPSCSVLKCVRIWQFMRLHCTYVVCVCVCVTRPCGGLCFGSGWVLAALQMVSAQHWRWEEWKWVCMSVCVRERERERERLARCTMPERARRRRRRVILMPRCHLEPRRHPATWRGEKPGLRGHETQWSTLFACVHAWASVKVTFHLSPACDLP